MSHVPSSGLMTSLLYPDQYILIIMVGPWDAMTGPFWRWLVLLWAKAVWRVSTGPTAGSCSRLDGIPSFVV